MQSLAPRNRLLPKHIGTAGDCSFGESGAGAAKDNRLSVVGNRLL